MRKHNLYIRFYYWILPAILVVLFTSCKNTIENYSENKLNPKLSPDYSGIIIPPNIAPLNFVINEEGLFFQVTLKGKESTIELSSNDGLITIPQSKWKDLLLENKGGDLTISIIRVLKDGQAEKFNDIPIKVAEHTIDNYISYRKIPPANIVWQEMGIMQRSLQSFDDEPIMLNTMTNNNCMHCHSFNPKDPDQFMFHMRGDYGGTIIKSGDKVDFVNTFSKHTRAPGAYPSWHPDGRYIAFSVNKVIQRFHSKIGKVTFVKDKYSDIILYDRTNNSITRPAILSTASMENLPSWAPDGTSLYYIDSPEIFDTTMHFNIKYDVLKIAFNPKDGSFGKIDTVLASNKTGKSITFPRVSPDNKYMVCVMLDYGYFSIYSKESDIFMVDLETGEYSPIAGNSEDVESYPSWSSNGRWIMFVTKRSDGVFSQPMFSYVDENGLTYKPFVLPQKDPRFYDSYFYNYNRPEFAIKKVSLNPRSITRIVQNEPVPVEFNAKYSVSATSGATIMDPRQVIEGMYQHD